MQILGTTIGAIIGYFTLIFITTNLLGMVVRGFFKDPEVESIENNGDEFIKQEIQKTRRAGHFTTILFIFITLGFYYLLFYFLGIFAVISAAMLQITRLPDLLWEIKHGQKIDTKSIPKDFKYVATTLINWAALPLLWWAIYSTFS